MGATYGPPPVNRDGLATIFDVKNQEYNYVSDTAWKLRSFSGDASTAFYIDPSIYDPVSKKFILTGDSCINLVKNADTTWAWGKTFSIRCKPEAGSYIYNDANGLYLYFTEDRRVVLMTSPYTHNYGGDSIIFIDSSNNITLMRGASNHDPGLVRLNINGNLIGVKRDAESYGSNFLQGYSYGKVVELDGYQYVGCMYGYVKIEDFLNSNNVTAIISNSSYARVYQGDVDVDSSYAYRVGQGYDNYLFKIPLGDIVNTTTFGTLDPCDGLGGFNDPEGVAVNDNYIFVCDNDNHRVMILNKENMTYNTHLGETGNPGSDVSLFNSPRICCVKNERLYVADSNNNRIKIYNDSTFEFIDSITTDIYPYHISVNDDYIATIDGQSGYNLRVIRLSDSSLVLSRSCIYNSMGPGEFRRYGHKCMREYNGEIYSYDRSKDLRIIEPSTWTFSPEYSLSADDAYDLAIDASYYYFCRYTTGGVEKINRITYQRVALSSSLGTGDGEWGGICYGLDVDSSYLYVSDTGNHRIQILNKEDLSYYSQFGSYGTDDDGLHFRDPRGLEIHGDKLYIADEDNNKIRIYDFPSLDYVDSFGVSSNSYKVRVNEDEIFVGYSNIISVYDISTYELKRTRTYNDSKTYISEPGSITNFDVWDNKIYLAIGYHFSIADRETLEEKMRLGPWYRCNLVDQVLDDENIFIEMVFTDDYKVKVYANGYESNEVNYGSADYKFDSISDITLGRMRDSFSSVEYDWFAVYNKAKTLEEHINDYNNLKWRD